MTGFAFQLYSLHSIDDPLPAVVERVGAAGFDAVEFAGLGDASVDELNDALVRADLSVAGGHVALEEIEDDPDAVAQTYRALGAGTVTVPWLDPEHFASRGAVEAAAGRLDEAAAALRDHDVALHYHNHDQEFVDLDGAPAIEALLEASDVGWQVDLGWVGTAGGDPLGMLERYADRIDLAHLKDYDAARGEPVEVGTGDLDLEATVRAVRDHDLDWLIYEAEGAPDDYATLEHAAAIVDDYWN